MIGTPHWLAVSLAFTGGAIIAASAIMLWVNHQIRTIGTTLPDDTDEAGA